jgi:N-acetylmuramoyl-L-alanine amidase
MAYNRIVLSSGHGKLVRGASCSEPWGLDEVDEARLVVDELANELRQRGAWVMTFHDNHSTTQGENLNAIVDFHNAQTRDLDVSVHFNAYEVTTSARGTEVLYKTQEKLAGAVSIAIASAGFIDRGAKKRDDLKFLNATEMPAILIEVCFVDSKADAEVYENKFSDICANIANVLAGVVEVVPVPPVETDEPASIDIVTSGAVVVTVNGRVVG